MPRIVWLLVIVTQRQQRVVAHIDRQAHEIVLLLMPAATLDFIVVPQVRPAPFRQPELHIARLGEHRRHHHRIPQHVLAVEVIARRVVRELQHHRPQHRRAEIAGQRSLTIQVRHQLAFQLGEVAHHVAGLVIVRPRHTVGFAAVQAAVAGEQPESAPALIDVRRSGVFKPADIVAPESEAGQANRQPAAQAFRHRFIVGVAVAAPMHRELLRTHGGRTGKQHRLFFSHRLFQHVPHQFVVDVGVMVVHLLRIGTVKPLDVRRDTLAEVGLEAVDADLHQAFQFVRIPPARVRVGEVVDRQPRLPFVPLPQGAVRALQQVALLFQLTEDRRFLADVRVDPHADLQPFLFQAADHPFRVGEGHRVPLKIAPLEGFHPEAVEVEHVQRQVALGHAVDKAVDRRFVVVSGEGGGQPQAERPRRRQRRTPGELRIAV